MNSEVLDKNKLLRKKAGAINPKVIYISCQTCFENVNIKKFIFLQTCQS